MQVTGFRICLRHKHPNEALLEVAELSEYVLVDLAAGGCVLGWHDDAVALRQSSPANEHPLYRLLGKL